MPIIHSHPLREFVAAIFAEVGAPGERAAAVAESLVTSNLMGHDSHGIIRVMQYVDLIRRGLLRPGDSPQVARCQGCVLVMDGGWTFGQVAARETVDRALQVVQTQGACHFVLRCSNHVGRLGEWVERSAQRGHVAMMMCNNIGSSQLVAPFGGREGRLSTNPIAFAAPHDGGLLLVDMTTSITAEGKLRVARNSGLQLPSGWIVDHLGGESGDPADFYGPPRGALLPLGGEMGHKGFGLGLMVEVLAGLLSGGGVAGPQRDARPGNALFGWITPIEAWMCEDDFRHRLAGLIDYLKSCPRREGVDEILIPGEPEARTRERRQREGIPVDDDTWKQLTELADQLGVNHRGLAGGTT